MNKALLFDLYELTMAQVYYKHKRNASATFDLFIRSQNRPFYVACGIDDALKFIAELRFTKEDIDYLRELTLFEDDFLDYLRDFKFKGEIWAVEEPEIIFSHEPILRVTANIIEAQIIESAILNKINLAVTLATKASRIVLAARGKGVYDFSLRRTQGTEAALAIAKYSYIVGAKGTSNVLAGSLYKIPVTGTMAHSYVMSFEREVESFVNFAQSFPTKTILLVDTYDVHEGIKSAIRVAKFLRREGIELLGIRLDSGNLAQDSKYARKVLDHEDLIDTDIIASGNLDEYKIEKLIEEKAPIDAFGVGTNMGCSSDMPFSDVIYKLVEIKEKGKDFVPTMKLSEAKSTLPSKKQVFRVFGRDAKMKKDIIVLDKEALNGKKLLRKVMAEGIRLYKEKDIEEKRKIFIEKIEKLPLCFHMVNPAFAYPVEISKKLSGVVNTLTTQIKNRIAKRIVFFMDIDTQYDFLDKRGSLFVKNSSSVLENIKKLTILAKKNEILIVSSQDTHTKDDPEFKEFPAHCIKGTRYHKKIKETMLKPYKVLTSKKVYSSKELKNISSRYAQIILQKDIINFFSNPNIPNLLETIFPEKIYVYGVVTEYCIKEAVEGIIKSGFPVAVVEDAIREISQKEKDKLFSAWRKRGVEFITTRELLRLLNK
ncbi:MAG: nicotinate phosphoribosyltransferase [Candidatus Omnitrophota bacterium]|nr:nicotinate phosphoribosyltransferase [Candidatus Omnitrophota bacterium]